MTNGSANKFRVNKLSTTKKFNSNVKSLSIILCVICRVSLFLLAGGCKLAENRHIGMDNFLLKEEDYCKS